ncbi:hypothetical protein QBC40DRAFT_9774 [Triangularia verruculosa]|uniref:Uncharacterized protein n=1 Tax=Triangularia verruculosa TaxID=2587418 RepID=A0AAN6XD31_9PEZI|nr:hypothetical protein QBC40DRAFT_9774 [Triangularia verruculosa]
MQSHSMARNDKTFALKPGIAFACFFFYSFSSPVSDTRWVPSPSCLAPLLIHLIPISTPSLTFPSLSGFLSFPHSGFWGHHSWIDTCVENSFTFSVLPPRGVTCCPLFFPLPIFSILSRLILGHLF